MKTQLSFKSLNLLIALLYIFTSFGSIAQNIKPTDELKDFKIVVEKTDIGIKLKSIEGSAWKDLSFSIKTDRPQAIDEYGMTKLHKVSSYKDSNLADFLFTITKTESGIVLKGIEGTAWINLSFSLTNNQKQAFDKFGMIELD